MQWLVDANHLDVQRATMFSRWLSAPRGDSAAEAEAAARRELAVHDATPEQLPESLHVIARPEQLVQLVIHDAGKCVGKVALFVRGTRTSVA